MACHPRDPVWDRAVAMEASFVLCETWNIYTCIVLLQRFARVHTILFFFFNNVRAIGYRIDNMHHARARSRDKDATHFWGGRAWIGQFSLM